MERMTPVDTGMIFCIINVLHILISHEGLGGPFNETVGHLTFHRKDITVIFAVLWLLCRCNQLYHVHQKGIRFDWRELRIWCNFLASLMHRFSPIIMWVFETVDRYYDQKKPSDAVQVSRFWYITEIHVEFLVAAIRHPNRTLEV